MKKFEVGFKTAGVDNFQADSIMTDQSNTLLFCDEAGKPIAKVHHDDEDEA